MQSTSSSFRNPETWHIAHTYQGKNVGIFQWIIIACIWDSCSGVEEGSCLVLSSGMLKGYTGLLSGCTSSSWWSNRERGCINENMGTFLGWGHLHLTVQEGGERIRGGGKGGPLQWKMGLIYWYWSGKLGDLFTSTSSWCSGQKRIAL